MNSLIRQLVFFKKTNQCLNFWFPHFTWNEPSGSEIYQYKIYLSILLIEIILVNFFNCNLTAFIAVHNIKFAPSTDSIKYNFKFKINKTAYTSTWDISVGVFVKLSQWRETYAAYI